MNPTSVPSYLAGLEYYPPCNACFYSPGNALRNHYQFLPEFVRYTLSPVHEAGVLHFSSPHPRSRPTNATFHLPPRLHFDEESALSFPVPPVFAEQFPAPAYQSRSPFSVVNPTVKSRHKLKR